MVHSIRFPTDLSIAKADISCFFLRDVGELTLDLAEEGLKSTGSYRNVNRRPYDPAFFSPVLTLTPLHFESIDAGFIRAMELPSSMSGYYADHSSKTSLVVDSPLEEHFYLFSSGILVYQLIIHLETDLDTDNLIFLSNCFVKLNPILTVSHAVGDECQKVFSPLSRLDSAADSIMNHCRSNARRSGTDSYTLLLIHRLGQSVEMLLEREPSLRKDLYRIYENEFHALAVRTIEDWQKRYPKGTHFNEPNISLSPVGILRINYRNTLAYEYPYSEEIVAKLYYPAVIELRAWSLILSIFISELQVYIDQLNQLSPQAIPLGAIETKRRLILNALDDFNGYVLSTSRRTTNLYRHSIDLFGIKDTTELVMGKLSSLRDLVARQKEIAQIAAANEASALQNRVLDRIQELLEAQESSATTIKFINFLLGGAVTFSVSQTLHLSAYWTICLFSGLTFAFWIVGAIVEKRRYICNKTLDIDCTIQGVFNRLALLSSLVANPKLEIGKIGAVSYDRGVVKWRVVGLGTFGTIVKILTRRRIRTVHFAVDTELLETLGSDRRYSQVRIKFETNEDFDSHTAISELAKRTLVDTVNQISDYSRKTRRGDPYESRIYGDHNLRSEDISGIEVVGITVI